MSEAVAQVCRFLVQLWGYLDDHRGVQIWGQLRSQIGGQLWDQIGDQFLDQLWGGPLTQATLDLVCEGRWDE